MDKRYTRGDLTVSWKPDLCTHSGNCVRGLSAVFNTRQRPWINMSGAGKDEIIVQVGKCPSGALSYEINDRPDEVTRK